MGAVDGWSGLEHYSNTRRPGRSLRSHSGAAHAVTVGDTAAPRQPALPRAHGLGAGSSLWNGHHSANLQPLARFCYGCASFAAGAQLSRGHNLPGVPQEMSCCKTRSSRRLRDLWRGTRAQLDTTVAPWKKRFHIFYERFYFRVFVFGSRFLFPNSKCSRLLAGIILFTVFWSKVLHFLAGGSQKHMYGQFLLTDKWRS